MSETVAIRRNRPDGPPRRPSICRACGGRLRLPVTGSARETCRDCQRRAAEAGLTAPRIQGGI